MAKMFMESTDQKTIQGVLNCYMEKGYTVDVTYSGGTITDYTVESPPEFMPGSYIYNEGTPVYPFKTGASQFPVSSNKFPKGYDKFRQAAIDNPPETEIELLDRAEEAIDQLGWIKGALHSSNGVCMVGALNLVGAYGCDQQVAVEAALARAIKNNMLFDTTEWDEAGPEIPGFNDAEETTLETVKLAFKHARHDLETS